MSKVFSFFTDLLRQFVDFAVWLVSVIKQLFKDAWNIATDVFCWGFDSILSIAVSVLDTIDIPFNPSTYYAMIPPDVANMLGLIKVPQAISMIVAALIVRFLLQTIPFVRWGS